MASFELDKTAVNDRSNSGKPDPKGKTELTVIAMPMSEFLTTNPQYLAG
jgi:hypothetical protein